MPKPKKPKPLKAQAQEGDGIIAELLKGGCHTHHIPKVPKKLKENG